LRFSSNTASCRHIADLRISCFVKATDRRATPDHVRESVLYPALDRAGIERVLRSSGFHAFRHAGSSIINELTGDLKLSQVQLGHKRLSTTANIYTHTNVRQVERAGEVGRSDPCPAEFVHQLTTKSPVLNQQGERGIQMLSNAMKKGRLELARIAGEGFEPPTFGL